VPVTYTSVTKHMKNKFIVLLFILASTAVFGQNPHFANGKVLYDGEPHLAINPNNAQHMVVTWIGWGNIIEKFKVKTSTSFDGGTSWSTIAEIPHKVPGYTSDYPSIDFNAIGEVFISFKDYSGSAPPVQGGIYLSKSTDGGITWDSLTTIKSFSNADEQDWSAISPSMLIDKSTGSYRETIYVFPYYLIRNKVGLNLGLFVSSDLGKTFNTRQIDTTGWPYSYYYYAPLIGSHTIGTSGVLYTTYHVIDNKTMKFIGQSKLAYSKDGGKTYMQQNLSTYENFSNPDVAPIHWYPTLFLNDPTDSNHLIYVYLNAEDYLDGRDINIYLIESFNGGINWSSPILLNDEITHVNGFFQLMGNFNKKGDLFISWSDRRYLTDVSFKEEMKIWATYKNKDSINFESNFQIIRPSFAYDSILESRSRNFVGLKLVNDSLYSTWGDSRDGKLNIWFQQMNKRGVILYTNKITSENLPSITVTPKRTNSHLMIYCETIKAIVFYNKAGEMVIEKKYTEIKKDAAINLESLKRGRYMVKVTMASGEYSEYFIKD
jgi:hypothetical protein